LLLLNSVFLNAEPHRPAFTASISGKIDGDLASVSHIKVAFYNNYIYNNDNMVFLETLPDKKGRFRFNISFQHYPVKLRNFMIGYKGQVNYEILSDFIIEKGDSINMDLTIHDGEIKRLHISGKGAPAYQCRLAIIEQFKIEEDQIVQNNHLQLKDLVTPVLFEERFRIYNECLENSLAILNKYKKHLSQLAYETMKADIIGAVGWQKESEIANLYSNCFSSWAGNADTLETVKKAALGFYKTTTRSTEMFSDRVLGLSPVFVDYLIQKEYTAITMQQQITIYEQPYGDLYFALKKKYSGKLREC
jgi:hypothetical protein